jgi:hypothetical protein
MRGTTETGRAYVQRVRPIGGRQEDIKIKEPKKQEWLDTKLRKRIKNFLKQTFVIGKGITAKTFRSP